MKGGAVGGRRRQAESERGIKTKREKKRLFKKGMGGK